MVAVGTGLASLDGLARPEDRQKVLDALYPFNDQPGLDDERLDIHTSRLFKVRDFIVTREGNGNFLVTPFYAEAGV